MFCSLIHFMKISKCDAVDRILDHCIIFIESAICKKYVNRSRLSLNA